MRSLAALYHALCLSCKTSCDIELQVSAQHKGSRTRHYQTTRQLKSWVEERTMPTTTCLIEDAVNPGKAAMSGLRTSTPKTMDRRHEVLTPTSPWYCVLSSLLMIIQGRNVGLDSSWQPLTELCGTTSEPGYSQRWLVLDAYAPSQTCFRDFFSKSSRASLPLCTNDRGN